MTATGVKQSARALAGAFVAVAALTAAELIVVGLGGGRSGRIAALVALLLAKAGVVLTFFLRVTANRRSARLTLAAIVAAIGFAVVLMLEAAFRAGGA